MTGESGRTWNPCPAIDRTSIAIDMHFSPCGFGSA
jgi:hypothetical protein